MGAFDWAVDLAKQLIDANGEAVVLKLFTSVDGAAGPWETQPSTEQSLNARAVFLNYNTKEAGQTYTDGTEIQRDDKKVLLAAKGLTFSPNLQGAIVREDGTEYRLIKIKCLDPGAQKIFFEIQARR
jgi:hypothetical protein